MAPADAPHDEVLSALAPPQPESAAAHASAATP
jgi:hypothetical protein